MNPIERRGPIYPEGINPKFFVTGAKSTIEKLGWFIAEKAEKNGNVREYSIGPRLRHIIFAFRRPVSLADWPGLLSLRDCDFLNFPSGRDFKLFRVVVTFGLVGPVISLESINSVGFSEELFCLPSPPIAGFNGTHNIFPPNGQMGTTSWNSVGKPVSVQENLWEVITRAESAVSKAIDDGEAKVRLYTGQG